MLSIIYYVLPRNNYDMNHLDSWVNENILQTCFFLEFMHDIDWTSSRSKKQSSLFALRCFWHNHSTSVWKSLGISITK